MHLIRLNQGFIRLVGQIVDLASIERYPLHIRFYDKRFRKQLEIIIKSQVPGNNVEEELRNRARTCAEDGTYSSEILDVVRVVDDDPASNSIDFHDLP